MRFTHRVLALLSLVSVPAFAETHYEAKHCEIFVDRLEIQYESHGAKTLLAFVKLANRNLQGTPVEIGFRRKVFNNDWENVELQFIAPDYYRMQIALGGGDYGSWYTTEGVFYVKTSQDVYYWLHPGHDEASNFSFSRVTFDSLIAEGRNGNTPTTGEGQLWTFNPDQCH